MSLGELIAQKVAYAEPVVTPRKRMMFLTVVALIAIAILGVIAAFRQNANSEEGSGLPELYVVGDSLGVATDPFIRQFAERDGVVYTFVGNSGASIDAGMAAVLEHRPSPHAVVLVALGTNDAIDNPARFAGFVEYVARFFVRYETYWINLYSPLSDENNSIIKEAADRWEHLHYVDWKTFALEQNIEPVDGVHYDEAGTKLRAEFFYEIYSSVVERDD